MRFYRSPNSYLCLLPNASRLLHHFIRPRQQFRRNRQSNLFRRLQVDDELKLRRLLHRQISRLGAFQDLVHVNSRAPIEVIVVRPICGRFSPVCCASARLTYKDNDAAKAIKNFIFTFSPGFHCCLQRKDRDARFGRGDRPVARALTLTLILTPLQKIIWENMLCNTENKSLLVEDPPYPIPSRIRERLSRPVGERIKKFNRKLSPFGGPI